MSEIKVKIPAHKFQNLFINHIRYSLMRKNLATDIAIEDIKNYWNLLNSGTRDSISLDIQAEIYKNQTIQCNNANKNNLEKWQNALTWINDSRSGKTAHPFCYYLPVVDPELIGKS